MSKMPAMSSFCARPLGLYFLGLTIFSGPTSSLATAQTASVQPRPAIIVSGTVRDTTGTPVPEASVFFEEKGTSASIDAKTDRDGTFSFLAMRAGSYVVRARKEGLREVVSAPMELSLGQRKQLDLVLSSKSPVHAKKQSKVNTP